MECFEGDSICTLQAVIVVDLPDDTIALAGCSYQFLKGAELNGNYFAFSSIIDLADPGDFEKINEYLSEALHVIGLTGTVSRQDSANAVSYIIDLTIYNTNAESVELVFDDCAQNIAFTEVFCCDEDPPAGTGQAEPVLSQNPDLFYESITYNGLDIAQIEIGSDCASGLMRNNFSYDANHRVTQMVNTFFNPDPLVGSYNTNYQYDLAGNILSLYRNGLVQIDGGIPEFGRIDSLLYTYADERLQSVNDLLDSTTLAQPKGFGPGFSSYAYDGNGNLTGDGGKGLTMHYNLLNLPDSITDQTNTIRLDYAFGGLKLRKALSGGEERFYMGGLEIADGALEAFYHPEGRVLLGDTVRFQYKLADHLGNTVVFFEDRDLDTYIKTESMTSDPDSLEVLQRNYYYPFGMEMEGPWNSQTGPGMRYLYNGKEFNEDLGWDWYDYGARYYDPSIGRWNGVDPLAEKFAGISPYAYVANNPLIFIDPDGRDIIVGGQVWTPGAQWQGNESDFGYQAFAALNFLTSHEGVGDFSFLDADGNKIEGNAILDFVEGGQFGDTDISISEVSDGRHFYGAENVDFDPTAGMQLNPTEGQGEGVISPAIFLLHEFGHAWLERVNSELKEKLADNFLISSKGVSYAKYGDNAEHDKILGELENPASQATGQGVRLKYRNTFWADEAPGKNWKGIVDYDLWIRTQGPTSTEKQ